MSSLKIISTSNAPKPVSHYSHAVEFKGLIFVSGQLPLDVEGKPKISSIAEQAKTELENIEAILKEAGSSKEKIVKISIFVSDLKLMPEVNKVYAEFFGNHKPARIVVPTGQKFPFNADIEIEAIAGK